MSFQIINANVLDGIPLADNSVHCVVTSPPYWGLRDYGVEGQIGLEPTIEEYLERMVGVCREVKRVLRPDGTFWLNMGDGYASGGGPESQIDMTKRKEIGVHPLNRGNKSDLDKMGLKPKDLIGQPWRLAFALQADGWWLRSDIIWSKPNPMPESVTDRPTKAHEYIFLLTKSAKYYYDQEAVREPLGAPLHAPGNLNKVPGGKRNDLGHTDRMTAVWGNPNGRNRRTVWEIPTQPFPEAHFATFPEALVEPCVKAGTSKKGCCPKCGSPWERVVEKQKGKSWHDHSADMIKGAGQKQGGMPPDGWRPTCECDKDPIPCTVLDIFSGSGTTGVVAIKNDCHYIGLELNPEYIEISRKRLTCADTGLTPVEYKQGQETLF